MMLEIKGVLKHTLGEKKDFDLLNPFPSLLGFIVRWKVFDPPTREQMYDDQDYWEVSTAAQMHLSA